MARQARPLAPSHTEPGAQTTSYTYDELGKLLAVTQPTVSAGTPVTHYKYDTNRNRVEQKDAKGHVVTLVYDELNRLTDLVQEGGLTTHHEYDANGSETLMADPNGQTVTTTYDELNRPVVRTYADAASPIETPWKRTRSTEYDYDANGNPTSIDETVVDALGATTTLHTTREYDKLDRLAHDSAATPDGQVAQVSYTYYANGTRQAVTDSTGAITRYEYDSQNRMKAARAHFGTPQEAVTAYAYWPDDLIKEVTHPSGVKASYAYDKAKRLTNLTNAQGATVESSYAYTYDANGNRTQQIETNGGVTEATGYTYDALDRLETVTYPADVTHANGRTITYGYDLVGNRERETERDGLNVVLSDKTATFDALNRLTAIADPVQPANNATFTWDNNGNLRSKTTGGVTTTYVYDSRDKLVETREGTQVTARFQYDHEGRRTKKIGDDGLVQYVYDGTSVLEELNATGAQTAKYEWGSDRLISLTRTNEARRYYSFDGLGSVVGLTDDAGAVVASYHLDAWGNYRFPQELQASKNRYGFTGYMWDAETDLYYAKARYFDPNFGRFLTQDSYLGQIDDPPSLHRYFYANANPLRHVDPTGHESVRQAWGIDEPQGFWKAFGKNVAYNTWNVISFGTLARQDKLVEQNESGQISDAQYWGRTAINGGSAVAIGVAAAATGGLAATGASALGASAVVAGAVGGAASGVVAQATTDLIEVAGTQTKSLQEVRASDYLIAGAAGGALGALVTVAPAGASKATTVVESAAPPKPTINPALQERLEAFKTWKSTEGIQGRPTSAQFKAFVESHPKLYPMGTGPSVGFARYIAAESNLEVRRWYHAQEDAIPSRLNPTAPVRDQGLEAFRLRNEIKLKARELMVDQVAARDLPAPRTLREVVRKLYERGHVGDDLWRQMIASAGRSNKQVDASLGMSRKVPTVSETQ